jgi:hypothetical protein
MEQNTKEKSLKEKLSSSAWNLWYMKKTNRLAIIVFVIGITAKAIQLIFFKG